MYGDVSIDFFNVLCQTFKQESEFTDYSKAFNRHSCTISILFFLFSFDIT